MDWRDEVGKTWQRLRGVLAGPWRSGRSLVEIRRALADDAVERVTYVGSGKRVFPYNRISVELAPLDEREQSEMSAAVEEGWSTQVRGAVLERLDDSGCAPEELTVDVVVAAVESSAAEAELEEAPPYRVRFERSEETPRSAARPCLELEVVRGAAEQEVYTFREDRILIGRLVEVLDEHGRVKRRNHLAFLDDGEENQTVSREQAHIVYRDDPAGYWLIDERSAYGTRIFRDGRPIDVSSRDRRGIRLKHGDEIYFGQASVLCEISQENES